MLTSGLACSQHHAYPLVCRVRWRERLRGARLAKQSVIRHVGSPFVR